MHKKPEEALRCTSFSLCASGNLNTVPETLGLGEQDRGGEGMIRRGRESFYYLNLEGGFLQAGSYKVQTGSCSPTKNDYRTHAFIM